MIKTLPRFWIGIWIINGVMITTVVGQRSANGDRPNILNNEDLEHLKHDIEEQYHYKMDDNKMDPREMEFHNFQLHDYDNNLYLDGLEILASLNHNAQFGSEEYVQLTKMNAAEKQSYWQKRFEKDAEHIDLALELFDLDHDGYISFWEYVKSIHPSDKTL